MESSGVLPTTQFAYRKGPVPGTHFCVCRIHCKVHLKSGQEAKIVQIDFSAAFDMVNRQGILYKLCSVGYWRFCVVHIDTVSIKSITARYVGRLGEYTGLRRVRSAAGWCFEPIIVPPIHFGAFSTLENELIGYAGDSTLIPACCAIPRR